MNPLTELQTYGQSVWLDYIRRSAIECGEITSLIKEDGVRGVTSNPAIFQKAIAGSSDYDATLQQLEQEHDRDPGELYEYLAIADIQAAADLLAPIYQQTNKRDGYVSLEVSPYLANQTEATISEARRLWQAVNRPNLMVKVPATPEGIPVIEQLISEGINVNVTLLFSQSAYQQVVEAYISGLEAYAKKGGDIAQVQSVASFFVSRIDTVADAQISEKIKATNDKAELESLLGKVAIANAKLAYEYYQKIYKEPRWQALAELGGATQRLLWASTGNKNPNYSEVRYVEELIGEDTVNTIPPATLAVFRARQRIATCLGFGPRFLHSTGQAYKGGPNTGVFIQITCDDAVKLPVPEHEYDFSLVKEAQARGDFQVLVDRDRRALRIHLSENVSAGLDKLQVAIEEALK